MKLIREEIESVNVLVTGPAPVNSNVVATTEGVCPPAVKALEDVPPLAPL